jgi:hypothetical protein
VGHEHAELGRGIDVDIVDADRVFGHEAQAR